MILNLLLLIATEEILTRLAYLLLLNRMYYWKALPLVLAAIAQLWMQIFITTLVLIQIEYLE
jgi:hypothetical protein